MMYIWNKWLQSVYPWQDQLAPFTQSMDISLINGQKRRLCFPLRHNQHHRGMAPTQYNIIDVTRYLA
jgi:hypothetical protein